MTNAEIRADLSQSMLGASISLGLLVDGLRGRIEPAAFAGIEIVDLHRAFAAVHDAAEQLGRVALSIREQGR
jgi:hypothetical protein